MKKVLALLLALVMVFALVACGGSDKPAADNSSKPADSAPADNSGDAAPTDKPATNEAGVDLTAGSGMGFYNRDYDYASNTRFKVAYIVTSSNFLYEAFNVSFEKWAELANVEYTGMFSANGDADLFCTTIETYAGQGYNGVLVDPDSQTYDRVAETCNDAGLAWMPGMSQPRNNDGEVVASCVGFDNYDFGRSMAETVTKWAVEKDGVTSWDKVGFAAITYSASYEIDQRPQGAKLWLDANLPELAADGHFFLVDAVAEGSAGMTADGAYNQLAPIVSTHPEIEYWCVVAPFDDMGIGASRALAENGYGAGKCNVSVCGGTALIMDWDAGISSTLASATYTAQDMFAEPIFFALYAYMNGDATPETIWPDWVNPEDGGVYAKCYLNSFVIYQDNYQHYMEWVDLVTGMDNSHYDAKAELGDFPNDHHGPY